MVRPSLHGSLSNRALRSNPPAHMLLAVLRLTIVFLSFSSSLLRTASTRACTAFTRALPGRPEDGGTATAYAEGGRPLEWAERGESVLLPWTGQTCSHNRQQESRVCQTPCYVSLCYQRSDWVLLRWDGRKSGQSDGIGEAGSA